MKSNFEYPEDLKQKFDKAKKLEKISIIYLLSAVILLAITMGNSQAMKTAWLDDALSLIPPISFLIASRLYVKKHNQQFPYGFHRIVSIGYFTSALALFVVGGFLFFDSAIILIKAEHPGIGSIFIFGQQIWLGYLMIFALLYSTIPSVFLGRAKLKIAEPLHEKNLYTDAKMNKADWMTGVAAIVGIIGIGFGLWWADSVAALVISIDIMYDGYKNLKQAILDILNQIPKNVENTKDDPLIKEIHNSLMEETWIADAEIRIREEGHIYYGEAFVKPAFEKNLLQNINNTIQKIENLNWLIHDFTIIPVLSLPKEMQ